MLPGEGRVVLGWSYCDSRLFQLLLLVLGMHPFCMGPVATLVVLGWAVGGKSHILDLPMLEEL